MALDFITRENGDPFVNKRGFDLPVNVKDYGAIGDGVTDDSAAIQAAIDAAWALHSTEDFLVFPGQTKNKPIGVIHFETGKTYLVESTINVPEGIQIKGNNSTITTNSAIEIIHVQGATGANYAGNWGGIDDLLVLGNSIATRGIVVDIVNRSSYKNIIVTYVDGIGIELQEVQYSTFDNVKVFSSKVGWLLSARPENTSLVTIDNVFINCGANRNSKYGWWLQHARTNVFERCDASRNLVVNVLQGSEINGYLPEYVVTGAGSGYPVSSFQTVTISGGTGTEAEAYAEIDGSGSVIGVYSLNCGTGYTTGHTITVGGGGTGATVTATAVDDAGLGSFDGDANSVNNHNNWYNLDVESNRDNTPTSGYHIWLRQGKFNTIVNPNFELQTAGTERPSEYAKFLRTDAFYNSFRSDVTNFPDILKPGTTDQYDYFQSSNSGGLTLELSGRLWAGHRNDIAVDENNAQSSGKIFQKGFEAFGANGRQSVFWQTEATSNQWYNKMTIDGDAQDRARLYVTGEIRVGDGTVIPNQRIMFGSGVPTASVDNGSLYLRNDGGTGTTLYIRENGAWVAK